MKDGRFNTVYPSLLIAWCIKTFRTISKNKIITDFSLKFSSQSLNYYKFAKFVENAPNIFDAFSKSYCENYN